MTIYFIGTESRSEDFFQTQLAEHDLRSASALGEIPPEAELLVISFFTPIDEPFLQAHPKLRFIATRSSGYDHIDLAACRARNIGVSNVPSYGENTVAEHTFALILALSRRLREVGTAERAGKFSFEEMQGFDLHGKTIGVIGTGRIGLHVIRLAAAFGMNVIAHDAHPSDLIAGLLNFVYVPFEELLRSSHIITLHVPLTPETVHYLDRDTLAKCRRGVLVINTARGGLIETEALLEALESGHVAGAGLDVLEDERVFRKDASRVLAEQIVAQLHADPISPEERHQRDPARLEEIRRLGRNERLLARQDVVFTPHTAFNSVEAVERIDVVTTDNIRAFLSGTPIHVVN